LHRLAVFAREPNIALNGGEDGLKLIRRLIGLLPSQLKLDGMALLEIEANQGSTVLELTRRQFSRRIVHIYADLEGRDRILEIRPEAG
jgi:release factor glutamine methyltransferase